MSLNSEIAQRQASLPQKTANADYSQFKEIEVRIDGAVAVCYLNREKAYVFSYFM